MRDEGVRGGAGKEGGLKGGGSEGKRGGGSQERRG